MRSAVRLGLVISLMLLCGAAATSRCHVRAQERVVLFGVGDDPGVFLWDSRFHLREYHSASFDEAQALLPHALLLEAGTRAVVIQCYHDDVQPKYRLSPDDAVDVRVLTGRYHGQTGWVVGGDVQVMNTRR